MHLGRDRTRLRPLRLLHRPQSLFRKFFGNVFDDRQRIPDRDVAVDQHRHLTGARDVKDPLFTGSAGIKRNEYFLEFYVVGAKRQPWPHRPRRIVPVADHELQRHSNGLRFFKRIILTRRLARIQAAWPRLPPSGRTPGVRWEAGVAFRKFASLPPLVPSCGLLNQATLVEWI